MAGSTLDVLQMQGQVFQWRIAFCMVPYTSNISFIAGSCEAILIL